MAKHLILLVESNTGMVLVIPRSQKEKTVKLAGDRAAEQFGWPALLWTEFDVGGVYRQFLKTHGPADRVFSLAEVAKDVAGVEYDLAHKWIKTEILCPSIQGRSGAGRGRGMIFSLYDAFVGGAAGAIHRAGYAPGVLLDATQQLNDPKTRESIEGTKPVKSKQVCVAR